MPTSPNQPLLSVATSTTTGIAPPRQLGRHGAQFWERVQHEYAITDCGGVELLMQSSTMVAQPLMRSLGRPNRFRLLVERERAHRAEHLARLTREPAVETAHTNLIFRERDGGLKPAAREHIDGPDGRGQVVAQVLSPEAMIERAQHNEWKRQLMRKAAAERDAERRGDARSLTGRFNNLLRAGGR